MIDPLTRRRLTNRAVMVLASGAAALGLTMLLWILTDVARQGAMALNWDFFTKLPPPPGMAGGGLANALVGTLAMTLLAAAIAIPMGLACGTYLAEVGRGRLAGAVRLVNNCLVSAPSIVVGVFVYLLLVKPFGHFSGYAGAVSLAILMVPVITRTTEEMLGLVPTALREAALAIGSPQWRLTVEILFRAARSGLITGILLATARVAGETAPLLFTALNSPYWTRSLAKPTANLTVTLFNYAMSPYDDWRSLAWGAALLITGAVLAASITARLLLRDGRG
ncbi:MAG: phosphate ABC transporter, permease protein PstA [Nitrospirae bacterium CG18_big_fil_WC_8_21_14_2_50_70_55]|nr:phosphate ABC transporter permease PstA [Deltaproteobacteria bacterium]OIP62794.1 MAG: phosphate ABC transporter, permease protein PstA [Nitrospirae bacterium CG2_30_70_394]PIQ03459.1 MAG: phosphate ABC transporter, permease protein PstA [Nitrospirae bacterium CG18_big_fil_WC_8_21_14_2_50_70_55]PIU79954.1 MAG: phosphate ABC transporter, permease protein PstA [Nitrospirae bacterium CG06_land_8_20_14_3_00_70_43]PIW82280.1 MAG: phosphate ABC transporter, permease protein PstA [Nitrospirae bacte